MKLIKIIISLSVIPFTLTACSTTNYEQSSNPGNRHIYGVDCSGANVDMSVCYDKAKNLCPAGYTVISKNTGTSNQVDSQIMDMYSASATTSSDKKGLTIECH